MQASQALPALALLMGCTTIEVAGTQEFVVVTGRLENLSYESIDIPDDILGHGIMTAYLHDLEVHSGTVENDPIIVKYFGHTYLRDQQTVTFRMQRREDGTYTVCASPGAQGFRCQQQ